MLVPEAARVGIVSMPHFTHTSTDSCISQNIMVRFTLHMYRSIYMYTYIHMERGRRPPILIPTISHHIGIGFIIRRGSSLSNDKEVNFA